MSVTIPLLIPASCRVSFYASRVTDVTEFSMSNRHFWRFSFCVFSALSSVWDVLENQKFLHISHLSVLCIHTFLPFFFEQGINKDINGADNYNISFPISFTSSLLYAKSSEYTKTSTRMNVAPQAWNSTKSNKTSAVFLQNAIDPSALSVSVICVGY